LTKDTQPPRRFSVIDREHAFAGRSFDVVQVQIELPSGRLVKREIVHHPGAVAIVPVLDSGDILLVRQDRPAAGQALWELPAGTLEPGEAPLACARRELVEETGYEASKWTCLSVFFTSPGICDEQMSLFRANALRRICEPDPEEIEMCRAFSATKLARMAQDGEIRDAKTLIGLLAMGHEVLSSPTGGA